MVRKDSSVNEIAKDIIKFLSKHIKIENLILFGSYLSGTQREDSDIDFVVISDDFEKMGVLNKIRLLAQIPVVVDSRV